MSYKVEGVSQVAREFAALSSRAQRAVVRDSLRSAARVVVKKAKEKAPVKTGQLKKGIVQAVTVQGADRSFALVGYRKEVYWGRFQELGTSHHPPHPFLRPALDESHDEIEATFVDALNRTIAARKGR